MRKYLLVSELLKLGKTKEEILQQLNSEATYELLQELYGKEVADEYLPIKEVYLARCERAGKSSRALDIIQAFQEGKSIKDVAKEFDCSLQYVSLILKTYSISKPSRSQLAVKELFDGADFEDVLSKYGIGRKTLREAAKKAGLNPPRKKKCVPTSKSNEIRKLLEAGMPVAEIAKTYGKLAYTIKNSRS